MNTLCPSCGAAQRDERTCQEIFDKFLAMEFSDPAYGAVHFLTVSCFMIQHGRYSDPALVWIAKQIHDYFEKGVTTEQIRLQAGREASQDKRSWRVNRQPQDPPQLPITWSMTIQDVAAKFQNAEQYCALVNQWARVTLQEMQPLIV